MIYLSGAVQSACLASPDLGLMLTPWIGNRPDMRRTIWAADNGCFTQPERFDGGQYLAWLDSKAEFRDRCLFATAPDVVGDAKETLVRSQPFFKEIRSRGYRAALVAQDGLESLPVPWDDFDAFFTGGTTEWKLSEAAYGLACEANERGKWTHQGRVNSWRRLKAAAVAGYDSADGTYIAFGPDRNLPRVVGWLASIRRGELMPLGEKRDQP